MIAAVERETGRDEEEGAKLRNTTSRNGRFFFFPSPSPLLLSFPRPLLFSFSDEEYEKLRAKISARWSWNRIKKLAKPIKAFRESLRDSSRKRVSFPGARQSLSFSSLFSSLLLSPLSLSLFFLYYVAFRLVAELGAIKLFALPYK